MPGHREPKVTQRSDLRRRPVFHALRVSGFAFPANHTAGYGKFHKHITEPRLRSGRYGVVGNVSYPYFASFWLSASEFPSPNPIINIISRTLNTVNACIKIIIPNTADIDMTRTSSLAPACRLEQGNALQSASIDPGSFTLNLAKDARETGRARREETSMPHRTNMRLQKWVLMHLLSEM